MNLQDICDLLIKFANEIERMVGPLTKEEVEIVESARWFRSG